MHYRLSDVTKRRSLALFGHEECEECGSDEGWDRGYSVLCEACEPECDSARAWTKAKNLARRE